MDLMKFNIDMIMQYRADENPEFAVIRLKFLSDGYNAHNIPITREILQRDAFSILGKPIVARYDRYTNDVEGHETDEIMVGYIPNNAEITFEESDNGLFACVDGLISKLYATDVYEMYRTNKNFRSVSVEFHLDWAVQGKELRGFTITGVTLLGLKYTPACTLASSEIVRFSLNDVNSFYAEHKKEMSLNDFVERRNAKLSGKTYKVNTTELKETAWGDVDKTKLRNTVMNASNRASLVKKVYLQVDSGWEEAPSSKLHYPVMELVGDTFYYNRYALSSAMAYARQNNETAVITKLNKLYKQFDLQDSGEGEDNKMATGKLEIEGREAWGEVIKDVQKHEGKDAYVDSIEKDHIIYTIDDVRYRVDADVEVGKDDKTVHADIKWGTKKKDADQKMSAPKGEKMDDDIDDDDDDDDDTEKMKKDKKKMSSNANVDPMAYEGALEKEAQTNAEFVKKLKEKDDIIMGQKEELEELRKFKEEMDMQKVKAEVTRTMESIKADVSTDTFTALQEEGMKCNVKEIDAWKNKAKSMAFDASKAKSTTAKFSDSIWTMGASQDTEVGSSDSLWRASSK